VTTLIRMRSVSLLLFALGGIAFLALTSRDNPAASIVSGFVSYSGLTAFIVTEAFGQLASRRTTFNRWVARVFLVPCALCTTFLGVYLFRVMIA
jgi:nitrogen fixation-related uncharacterized protein